MPLILPTDWRGRVRRGAGLSPDHAALSQRVLARAVELAQAGPVVAESEPGGRRLGFARTLADRVRHALVAHALSADPKHLQLLESDLRVALDLPDWADDHLLDMAELATALALGLDGAGPFLSRDLADQVADALCRRFLIRATGSVLGGSRWSLQAGNWAFVCGGAMIMVAAVVGSHQARAGLAQTATRAAQAALGPSLAAIGPDGEWPEGVVYRDLAAAYGWLAMQAAQNVPALQISPDTFRPLLRGAGLRAALTGPSGLIADFGDDLPQAPLPVLGPPHRHLPDGAFDPLHLLWGCQMEGDDAPPPPVFLGRYHAVLRQGDDFLALRIGDCAAHDHAHADLGAPVWDHGRQRLLTDPGRGDYAAPGYFDPTRRLALPGVCETDHGTLTLPDFPQAAQMSAEAGMQGDALVLTMRAAGQLLWQRRLWFAAPGHLRIADRSLRGITGPARWQAVVPQGVTVLADLPKGTVAEHGRWASAKGGGTRMGFEVTADALTAGVQVGLRVGSVQAVDTNHHP